MKGLTAGFIAIVIAAIAWMLFPTAWSGDSYSGTQTQDQFAKAKALVIAYADRHRGLHVGADVSPQGTVRLHCDGTPMMQLWRDANGATSLMVVEGAESRAPDIEALTRALASQLGDEYEPSIARRPLEKRGVVEAFVLKWRDGIDFSSACTGVRADSA